MSHSNLTNEVCIAYSGNYRKGRKSKDGKTQYHICKITPHQMGGILTGKQCAKNIFGVPGRKASANYCIGVKGDIVCNVEEEDRAFTSSSEWNDCQAITIEVSNDNTKTWSVSQASWNSLVKLCADICKRYNFRLNYTGTKYGSLTKHKMFANTDCPGPYLEARMNKLAQEVNAILDKKDVVDNYNNGDIVEINTPMLFTGAIQGNRYMYDTRAEITWISEDTNTLIKNNNLIARCTFVCYAENDTALVQVFNDQFRIKKECVTKKL